MRQLTILVDMDDTIEHLLEAWVDCLNERHGTTVKYDDITEWDLCKAFPTLTKEQIHAPLVEDKFWKAVRPMDGAAEALKWMKDEGHKVYIVTASAYKTIQPKMDNVLFKYFPFLTWDDVFITTHKQLIRGDIMFDDAPHNLEGFYHAKVLMDAPHNRNYDAEANGMYRMTSWDEAKPIIQAIGYKEEMANWREHIDEFVERSLCIELLPFQKTFLKIMVGGKS